MRLQRFFTFALRYLHHMLFLRDLESCFGITLLSLPVDIITCSSVVFIANRARTFFRLYQTVSNEYSWHCFFRFHGSYAIRIGYCLDSCFVERYLFRVRLEF